MIDFSALVLGPCQDVFGVSITIDPLKSQPSVPPYDARGIWTVKDVDVIMEDGTVLASKSYEIGVRLSEYPIPPVKTDQVTVNANTYAIDEVRPDGQGGAKWVLKALSFNTD